VAYKLIFLKRAEKDLDNISKYKAGFYPGTAIRFVDEVDRYRDIIEENPYAFPVYQYNPRYRRAVIMDYLLFYKVFDKSRKVKVYRVLHGKRDIEKCL